MLCKLQKKPEDCLLGYNQSEIWITMGKITLHGQLVNSHVTTKLRVFQFQFPPLCSESPAVLLQIFTASCEMSSPSLARTILLTSLLI